jgi:ABC-type glycerol-3-phosphate transport system substrate-binding protein
MNGMKRSLVVLICLLCVPLLGAAPKVNQYGWEVPDKTLVINDYAGQDDPNAVWNKHVILNQYLQDVFNVRLNKIIYDNDVGERLNLMLASNDYPDVIDCLSPSQAQQWIGLGKAVNLTPLVDKYAPNFVKRLGTLKKRFLDSKGQMYMMPNQWGILNITDYAPEIRWDWWRELGSPKIQTPDDYYNVLKAMVAKHPTNDKGEKTYAMAFIKDRQSYTIVGAMWGLKKGWKDSNGTLTYFLNTPEGLALTRYVNRFYRDGLLDPDSFVVTLDDWRIKISNQRLAGHIGDWWIVLASDDFWPQSIKNFDTRYDRYTHVNVKAPGVAVSTFNPKDANGYYRTIITDKATDPAGIMKWVNFEATDVGIKFLGWGVPTNDIPKYTTGENYGGWFYTSPTDWHFDPDRKALLLANKFNFDKFNAFAGAETLALYQGFMDDGTTVWYDQNFNNEVEWKKIMNTNMKESMFDFSAFYAITMTPDDPLSVKWQRVQDLTNTQWVQAVMAKTDADCVNAWNALVKAANDAGLKDVEKFYSDHYKANLAAWK